MKKKKIRVEVVLGGIFHGAEIAPAHRAATGRDRAHFFFQAEDGILDKLVTGVQTCALPISTVVTESVMRQEILAEQSMRQDLYRTIVEIGRASVGKECRSRWSPYH